MPSIHRKPADGRRDLEKTMWSSKTADVPSVLLLVRLPAGESRGSCPWSFIACGITAGQVNALCLNVTVCKMEGVNYTGLSSWPE